MKKSNAIEVKNLIKRYGDVYALNDVDPNISDGEYFVLLGPSGGGKTTLLRSIGGFIRPDSGSVEIKGKNVKEVLKKGCPFNFNILKKDNSINSTYNGITFTVDMLDENPCKVRLFSLRSFGESLYHSITDASLEFGYKSI